MNGQHVDELTPQLRRVLRDCRKLYVNAARQMVRRHPTLLGAGRDGFEQLMEDLHRGLLIKVYATVIRSDGRWSRTEKYVSALLIEHLWDQRLRGAELREAAEGLLQQADRLHWESLVAPFVRWEPLRDSIGHVETVVTRLANLVAKCDGLTTPEETLALHSIQQEIDLALRPGPCVAATAADRYYAASASDAPSVDASGVDAPAGSAASASPVTAAPQRSAEERLAEALAELESLIGLEAVKDRVRSLSNFLQLQRQRQQAGLSTMPISLHMAFVGNPGTGKTTVARIVGQILGAMGILRSGHLVETDRSGLVAAYAGQTGAKTNQLCDSALDGVLFIDEAYSLIDSSGDDAYGREALQTLLKRMEDHRDRLVVILAGYPDEMDQMIRTNPGLSSRINTRLKFDDYGPADLGRIFERLCDVNQYRLPAASRHRLLIGMDELYRERDRHFGNGRLARNAFEDSVRRLADRIAGIVPLTAELLTELIAPDIRIPGLDDDHLQRLIAAPHTLRASCPKCGKRLRVAGQLLGANVRCPSCKHPFRVPWADVER